MPRHIVIRGALLDDYPFVLILVATIALTSISLWRYSDPPDRLLSVIAGGSLIVGDCVTLIISRRTLVEIRNERIRWVFRRTREQGDEPVTALQSVTIYPSGALLSFSGGPGGVMVITGDFRKRDIMRIVDAVQELGVPVDGSRGPIDSFIDALLGRHRRDHL